MAVFIWFVVCPGCSRFAVGLFESDLSSPSGRLQDDRWASSAAVAVVQCRLPAVVGAAVRYQQLTGR